MAPQSGQVSTTDSDSGLPGLVYLQSAFGHLIVASALDVDALSSESEQLAVKKSRLMVSNVVAKSGLISMFFILILV